MEGFPEQTGRVDLPCLQSPRSLPGPLELLPGEIGKGLHTEHAQDASGKGVNEGSLPFRLLLLALAEEVKGGKLTWLLPGIAAVPKWVKRFVCKVLPITREEFGEMRPTASERERRGKIHSTESS